MVYVLVNNNYHIIDLEKYKGWEDGEEVVLIRVPHTLDLQGAYQHSFTKILTYKSPIKGVKSLLAFKTIKKTLALISEELKPGKKDVLVFFTEFEILNQYIVKMFKDAGSRVIMLEDGMATVALGNMEAEKLPFKYWLYRAVLRTVYQFKTLDLVMAKGMPPLPVMEDKYIDAIGLSIKSPFKRNIPVYQLKASETILTSPDENAIIFINQDLYKLGHISLSDYIEILRQALSVLSANFTTVYFKFHPREETGVREEIKKMADTFRNVTLINDFRSPVENQVEELRPGYSASFYSNSLRSLYFKGIEPFFLFHLLPGLKNTAIGGLLGQYLDHIGYNFIGSFAEMAPGYKCGIRLEEKGVTLNELINGTGNKERI
ncbi:polysialyltransferase family glycosyltransferase [Chitinophaga sp. YIM B06452]|uniref:polysialyltransferase family glycosyltransferase n=1 Tax=Chitinophaga sp. YIM B06452 TaxID=3082158 RepID=UPI0031FEC8A1